jgi:hypothetical protein
LLKAFYLECEFVILAMPDIIQQRVVIDEPLIRKLTKSVFGCAFINTHRKKVPQSCAY